MSASSETPVAERQILIVGPYGVLGTGVVDADAENPKWGIVTAARRPAPTYRTQAAPPHISVDLMDREGTIKAFSSLGKGRRKNNSPHCINWVAECSSTWAELCRC